MGRMSTTRAFAGAAKANASAANCGEVSQDRSAWNSGRAGSSLATMLTRSGVGLSPSAIQICQSLPGLAEGVVVCGLAADLGLADEVRRGQRRSPGRRPRSR